jgi:predicted Zn-dependent protease
MSRIEMLKGFIAQRPTDPFPRYALALEYRNGGRLDDACELFEALMREHPDYTAAYLHAGQALIAHGRPEDARGAFSRGIEACVRRGDSHARGELEAALAQLHPR